MKNINITKEQQRILEEMYPNTPWYQRIQFLIDNNAVGVSTELVQVSTSKVQLPDKDLQSMVKTLFDEYYENTLKEKINDLLSNQTKEVTKIVDKLKNKLKNNLKQ